MKLALAFLMLAAAEMADFKLHFASGLAAYNNENFGLAIVEFEKSYILKSHSKTTYYIALCYFKLGNYSLAEQFARKSLKELPVLSDVPYIQNINQVLEVCMLAPRFRRVQIDVLQSNDVMTPVEMEEQKTIEDELNMFYSETPEGQRRLNEDFKLVQSRSLPNENELKLNIETGQFYRESIIDTLDN